MKSNKKNAVPSQNPHFFADNIEFTIKSDFVQLQQILCFSPIEGGIIP